MSERDLLVRFAESAKGFDVLHKLKLVLFAVGVKPNAYVVLKINSKNLEEKAHFESHLVKNNILFNVGKPKSYEEIVQVKDNVVKWGMCGTWYGYDLFRGKNALKLFNDYKSLLRRQKHEGADEIAGMLYGYPSCCVKEYGREHDVEYLRGKFDYCGFHNRLRLLDKKFPFIFHYACGPNCRASARLNKKYSLAVKKHAPRLWGEFSGKKTFVADVLVDVESDVLDDNAKSLWPVRDCHDYSLVSAHPVDGHFFLFSVLVKSMIPRGTVASARISLRYNFADVELLCLKDFVGEVQHYRKFLVIP